VTADPDNVISEADRQSLAQAGDNRRPGFLDYARRYARHRIAHGLDGLWVSGLPESRAALADRPLLFTANHVAWWDPLLLLVLDEALDGVGWAVMDAANLRKLPFLGWVGALPLDRSSHEHSRKCLQACAALLDRPGRSLWIFPQGRQRPAHLRPLDLKPGVQIVHASRPVDVIAVSINYVFLEKDSPAAVVRFSPPMPGSDIAGTALLPAVEGALLNGLDVIDAAATAATDGHRVRSHPDEPFPGFTPLIRPARVAAQDGFGARMLDYLRRWGPRVR
jgi:hypothetical protein